LNIPATLNMLLKHASGQWVLVLNGDDFYEVKNMVALLTGNLPEVPSVLCGQVSVLSANGRFLGFRDCQPSQLGKFMSINHPAMLVDRRIFSLIGDFNKDTPVAYDYVWAWSAYRKGVPFIRYEVILAHARLGGISQTKAHQSAKELLKSKMSEGVVFASLMHYMFFLGKSCIRKMLPESIIIAVIKQYRIIKGTLEHY